MPDSVDHKWVDIVSPLAPHHEVGVVVAGFTFVLLVVLLGAVVMFYFRPRFRAKRALQRLARQLHHPALEAKSVCIQVRSCLRSGLGQDQLQSAHWRAGHDADWLVYVNRLAECCFAAPTPSIDELDKMIREALAWLDRKTVND